MNKLYSLLLQAQPKVQNREEGQGIIEYTLVAGVIALSLFAAFVFANPAGAIGDVVGNIVDTINTPTTTPPPPSGP